MVAVLAFRRHSARRGEVSAGWKASVAARPSQALEIPRWPNPYLAWIE